MRFEGLKLPTNHILILFSANNFDNEIVDMDMDSPFSPTFSECSDLFEPPSLFTPTKKGRKANGNVSSSTKMHSKPGKKGRKGNKIASLDCLI